MTRVLQPQELAAPGLGERARQSHRNGFEGMASVTPMAAFTFMLMLDASLG